jgi:MFS superfamily sulfate permease-like transporter
VIYRFGAQLFFANAESFHTEIEQIVETTQPPVQTFVLDAEAIDDIDTTGAEALEHVINIMKARSITFNMARVSEEVRDLLVIYELMEKIGEEHLFASNQFALEAFIQQNKADAGSESTPPTPAAPSTQNDAEAP